MIEQFLQAIFVDRPVLGFAFVVSLFAAVYMIIEEFAGGRRQLKPRFQIEIEMQEQRLAAIEEINRRAAKEIDQLADIAKKQIDGNDTSDLVEQVRQGFDNIDRITEEHGDPNAQVWVRAVAGAFRIEVRRLVHAVDAKQLDPHVAIEFLDDARRKAAVDLLPKVFDDGQVKYRFPRWPDGTPVDLQGTEWEDPESPASVTG